MAGIKVIITGATGMVGEGVLFECLQNPKVSEVLIINRKHYVTQHPKLKELIVPDFFQLEKFADQIKEYDACFFCAGVSSVGMKEDKYTHITYDTTLHLPKRCWPIIQKLSLPTYREAIQIVPKKED